MSYERTKNELFCKNSRRLRSQNRSEANFRYLNCYSTSHGSIVKLSAGEPRKGQRLVYMFLERLTWMMWFSRSINERDIAGILSHIWSIQFHSAHTKPSLYLTLDRGPVISRNQEAELEMRTATCVVRVL
ncbi:hypothetical protein SISNIDRAFT_251887 [Sistotremastrum niveocremeum HHB9708]|uniref:Uncharacterized protein n=1 Tax=Sistotremastrum niveocremeum HHB9708 TaxID=1314777 RepID=A0A164Z1H6_9AGAM|nr:hypothetical protein SISNIDRAFT_251887 [Sistotremastrum niveocremeum HHB9708]